MKILRLGKQELEVLLAKTAKAAAIGRYEPFKTTSIFDGTAKIRNGLAEPPEVQQLMQA